MRAFDAINDFRRPVDLARVARAAAERSPCCPECLYPNNPGVCIKNHWCACHDVELD